MDSELFTLQKWKELEEEGRRLEIIFSSARFQSLTESMKRKLWAMKLDSKSLESRLQDSKFLESLWLVG
jgi:hypothetical protein